MVAHRTKEIGVKIALGAHASRVVGGVLRDALVVTGAGSVIGFAGSYWAAGQLQSWLFGVGRFDVGVYMVVTAVTVVLALIAASLPARRAAKVDPVVALRS
jgi:ABC-type antimicrobial peptide transport system permease subunit